MISLTKGNFVIMMKVNGNAKVIRYLIMVVFYKDLALAVFKDEPRPFKIPQ